MQQFQLKTILCSKILHFLDNQELKAKNNSMTNQAIYFLYIQFLTILLIISYTYSTGWEVCVCVPSASAKQHVHDTCFMIALQTTKELLMKSGNHGHEFLWVRMAWLNVSSAKNCACKTYTFNQLQCIAQFHKNIIQFYNFLCSHKVLSTSEKFLLCNNKV